MVKRRKGRPHKANVKRDAGGRSRGETADVIKAVVMAQRIREVGKDNAGDPLSGHTLGRLLLRWRASKGEDPSGISEEQFHAGELWAAVVRRHAAIMGYSLGRVQGVDMHRVGGRSLSSDPADEDIARIRDQWKLYYNELMKACSTPLGGGMRIRDVTYGVCVEDWDIRRLVGRDFGDLRTGLNALARVAGLAKRRAA